MKDLDKGREMWGNTNIIRTKERRKDVEKSNEAVGYNDPG